MDFDPGILEMIPHRPPFLWVDSIISFDEETIVTEKYIPPDLDIFKGHYPEYPVMPGVLVCEAVFQTGALFMSMLLRKTENPAAGEHSIPVLTRIKNAKFKKVVKPGDTMRIQVSVAENIGSAWFFKGKVLVGDKTAVKVDFGCALAPPDNHAGIP